MSITQTIHSKYFHSSLKVEICKSASCTEQDSEVSNANVTETLQKIDRQFALHNLIAKSLCPVFLIETLVAQPIKDVDVLLNGWIMDVGM